MSSQKGHSWLQTSTLPLPIIYNTMDLFSTQLTYHCSYTTRTPLPCTSLFMSITSYVRVLISTSSLNLFSSSNDASTWRTSGFLSQFLGVHAILHPYGLRFSEMQYKLCLLNCSSLKGDKPCSNANPTTISFVSNFDTPILYSTCSLQYVIVTHVDITYVIN